MKSFYILITIFLILFGLGCGENGHDGRAYLSINWDDNLESYWDNNPSIPENIFNGEYYRTNAGRFQYNYEIWEYDWSDWELWEYSGTYKIYIEPGESGGFMVTGADGDDNYFDLQLLDGGPSFFLTKAQMAAPNDQPQPKLKKQMSNPVDALQKEAITIPSREWHHGNLHLVIEGEKRLIRRRAE